MIKWFWMMLLAFMPMGAGAQDLIHQNFTLHAGWNAVYLEVAPTGDVAEVLSGIPYTSVWTWDFYATPAEKIQDQSEGQWNEDGWLVFFPASRPESMFNNLFQFQANRAYLIHMSAPASLTVSGMPELKKPRWRAGTFNLTGFPVDPLQEPSFADFFAEEESLVQGPVFTLIPDGTWIQITDLSSTVIQSGKAYWVYCSQATDFVAPLKAQVPLGNGLDYGALVSEWRLILEDGMGSGTIDIQQLDVEDHVPLTCWHYDSLANQTDWLDLPELSTWNVQEMDPLVFRLGVDRSRMTGEEARSVLEITDGLGSRLWIPVSAKTRGDAVDKTRATGALTGLWVGTVEVDMVSQARVQGSAAVPTTSFFSFRLIVHISNADEVRLIKNVVLMRKPDQNNQPGPVVLVTDDVLLPQFEGIALLGEDTVGMRISTVAYDFPGDAWLLGTIDANDHVAGVLSLEAENPTNPFLHRYHPDHDNLNADFEPITDPAYMESFAVNRHMDLTFLEVDPFGNLKPAQESETLCGLYQETLSGLHFNDIQVQGKFRLRRASDRGVLND